MIREFIWLPLFIAKWKHLGLGDDDMRQLEKELLDNPKVGAVMRGTGGVRKMRFAYENKGKSGALRVIYVDFEVYKKIYFVDVYAKSEKDNLTQAERNDIRSVVEILESTLELQREE